LADQYRVLRERRVDLVLGRLASTVENDIETQTLYHDRTFVVAGLHSRWSTRRKIDLTELANEPWGVPSPDTLSADRPSFTRQRLCGFRRSSEG
jgi:hypothetical protein